MTTTKKVIAYGWVIGITSIAGGAFAIIPAVMVSSNDKYNKLFYPIIIAGVVLGAFIGYKIANNAINESKK
jgi:hypothetical protein